MTERAGLLQEAVLAAKRGDGGAARSLLLRASESEPGNDLVWLWLAHLSTSPADKASYLRRVLLIHPGHEVARAELADALRGEGVAAAKAGSRRRARALLENSIELDDGKEDSWLWLAAVAESKEERRRCLERVLAIDPRHRHALALLDLPELRQEPQVAVPLDVLTHWRRGREVSARPVRRGSVLVVDDSSAMLKLVASSLEPHGFEVATATSGPEALNRLRGERPDVVLLEIDLPGMDGYQVCKSIQADPDLRKVPVAFLSGRGSLFDRMRGRLAGSSEHVQKPFEPQALLALVERFVAAGQGRGEAAGS